MCFIRKEIEEDWNPEKLVQALNFWLRGWVSRMNDRVDFTLFTRAPVIFLQT